MFFIIFYLIVKHELDFNFQFKKFLRKNEFLPPSRSCLSFISSQHLNCHKKKFSYNYHELKNFVKLPRGKNFFTHLFSPKNAFYTTDPARLYKYAGKNKFQLNQFSLHRVRVLSQFFNKTPALLFKLLSILS